MTPKKAGSRGWILAPSHDTRHTGDAIYHMQYLEWRMTEVRATTLRHYTTASWQHWIISPTGQYSNPIQPNPIRLQLRCCWCKQPLNTVLLLFFWINQVADKLCATCHKKWKISAISKNCVMYCSPTFQSTDPAYIFQHSLFPHKTECF